MKEKTCKQCKSAFSPRNWGQAFCSPKCYSTYRVRKHNEMSLLRCKECKISFYGKKVHIGYKPSFCSQECRYKALSRSRTGKKNPAYRDGLTIGKRVYTGKHLRACAEYRKSFLERRSYLSCEVCGVNQNGTMRFEVHHIYWASKFPKHLQLHNLKNLILICIQCHNDFHLHKKEKEFGELERERGLRELFGLPSLKYPF